MTSERPRSKRRIKGGKKGGDAGSLIQGSFIEKKKNPSKGTTQGTTQGTSYSALLSLPKSPTGLMAIRQLGTRPPKTLQGEVRGSVQPHSRKKCHDQLGFYLGKVLNLLFLLPLFLSLVLRLYFSSFSLVQV